MEKSVIDHLIDNFKKATVELENLQLQIALGKADAKDKFEEVKKRFNLFVQDSKNKYNQVEDLAEELHTKFDELRVQLALGKAETKDIFEAQAKRIRTKIHEIELFIDAYPQLKKALIYVQHEFERIKLELEIIAINFNLERLNVTDSIEQRRKELQRILNDLQEGLKKHLYSDSPSEHKSFREQIEEAIHHLREKFV